MKTKNLIAITAALALLATAAHAAVFTNNDTINIGDTNDRVGDNQVGVWSLPVSLTVPA